MGADCDVVRALVYREVVGNGYCILCQFVTARNTICTNLYGCVLAFANMVNSDKRSLGLCISSIGHAGVSYT